MKEIHPLSSEISNLLTRAVRIVKAAKFGPISDDSAAKYASIAAHISTRMSACGDAWNGIDGLTRSRGYAYAIRAAWAREAHAQVARAIDDLRAQRCTVSVGVARLRLWVPEAESCPPRPVLTADERSAPGSWLSGLNAAGETPAPSGSKRRGISRLPEDWLDRLWTAAEGRGCKHLDAVALLIVSGCRPAEAVLGSDVFLFGDALEVLVNGVKVTDKHGQPWRRLRVAIAGGAAEHLAGLAKDRQSGFRVAAQCTPGALSMMITDLGTVAGLPGRLSAYDIRHQRSADVKAVLTPEDVAAWLGHSALDTQRYYGRAPKAAGSRGPLPISVSAARPVSARPARVIKKSCVAR
jgi:integrase